MPCAYGFIRQVTSSSAFASLHVLCDVLVYSEFDSLPVNTEKVLMQLEGLGAAILGGGTDADAVATMHGLSRCARAASAASLDDYFFPRKSMASRCAAGRCSACCQLLLTCTHQPVCYFLRPLHSSCPNESPLFSVLFP